jgi:hypothetical protein
LLEEGDGLPELKSIQQLLNDLNSVDFTVKTPWYFPLQDGDSLQSLSNFRASRIGRWLTHNMVWLVEKTEIAAQGSAETLTIL